MNLHVWWDRPADGPWNMAADELLAAESTLRDACCVRVYGWRGTSVSLGGFQRVAAARAERSIAGVPLVRRPSGGGAIVHGSDLTYAAAVPKSHPWGGSPRLLYDALHGAMRLALADHGVVAALWTPDVAGAAARHDEAFFCFDRRSSGDLVLPADADHGGDVKIMGSAQRRLAAAVMQHGSLLLERNRGVPGEASHPGLRELTRNRLSPADARPLAERWLRVVADSLAMNLVAEEGPFAPEELVRERARRFADCRWTGRR